ncbi:MAG: tRNA (N(6)-L-threonylcarbamoyladenosine(37)-C(2))-methylthiotransferase MtaB [Kosmotoga sp.]|uniref:tRNA (N(6)-L-threonylcarbamoyladenosine(37)-C(2))- methylthiotransferase MtaB n=1 Tax=Kosmotoga sp. TaxID=1955248 RepID=UPI001D884421|nr:tRNA (N(6)-L-threonylcarbamoyladenosine(37)-C(2))-methylthiotransferase MtaB [Kosmotoga sp.]MBO8166272.1 tRNA (N(6)-L-threonylcarbamoyladenosine(37)-C(2))-methylthiotransferase MtaB [Kosmotoga sp.]
MKKVSIFTLGCKLNQYESQGMAEKLSDAFLVAFDDDNADIYIINSCTVTAEAERKLRQLYRRLKRRSPESIFTVVGCYSETSPNELKELGFDLVLGVKQKRNIKEEILRFSGKSEPAKAEASDNTYFSVHTSPEGRTRAYIGIEDGCLNRCAYCRIRLARGSKIESKPLELVADEFLGLLKAGFKEIVLTGINIGYYGYDSDSTLVKLLKRLLSEDGSWRIRLSSLDPRLISPELIQLIAENSEKIAQHVHLSLQSGSDRVLKLMRRGYTRSEYKSIVNAFRKINPLFSFTTDVIVGFPGETEEDFKETLEFIRELEFLKIHIFRFSPRPGTEAAHMTHQIPGHIKKERALILKKVAEKSSRDYLKKQLGKESEVLIERCDGEYSFGYDEYFIQHKIPGCLPKDFVRVKTLEISETGAFSSAEFHCRSMVT